ncbi:uncharacterized protein [Haliotis asinina]|uniref:uncharacterized protein n=1 Tax=Haliotis asinina TaxID=109174 RepID=UPI003532651A
MAAAKAKRDVFDFLMRMGADSSRLDDFGNNILHFAITGKCAGIIQDIIWKGMVDINYRGEYERTALMDVAKYGDRNIFALLVKKGALTNLVDCNGHNILHIAVKGNNTDMVRYILSQSIIDIKARDKSGKTAAMIAKIYGFHRFHTLLSEKGCPLR